MGETPKKGRIFRKGLGRGDQVAGFLAADFHSELVEEMKVRGYCLEAPDLTILLAHEFGFCYGVDRALGYAYETCQRFPDRRIFITGDVIHNPRVNERLQSMGVTYLPPRKENPDRLDIIRPDDVVLLPAFGAQREDADRLEELGCTMVDTTCGSVLLVWKSVEKYAHGGYTAVIHGKYNHAETRATCSQILKIPNSHYLVLLDLDEAHLAAGMIRGRLDPDDFLKRFKGRISPGFDPVRDLERIGLANQTTMLSSESLAVGEILRNAMIDRYGAGSVGEHYRSFETVCSATQDRQDAVDELLKQNLDLLIVIGGHKSSNTGHLAEIAHKTVTTYHVEGARDLLTPSAIRHLPVGATEVIVNEDWLPSGPVRIGLTAGASTPDRQVGRVIDLLLTFRNLRLSDYIKPAQSVQLFINGHIITNNPGSPRAEAMAVGDGKIKWIGQQDEMPPTYKDAEGVRDLEGAIVLPGLADAHIHVEGLGRSLEELNFTGLTSYTDLIQMVADAAGKAPEGEWIHGRGWDQNNWRDSGMPDHRPLSAVSPGHPVYLRRVDGHAALANTKALEIAGITKTTIEPSGGRILKTGAGEVLGVLIDEAMSLVNMHIPEPARDVRKRRIEKGLAECARMGLTMVHDAGAGSLAVEIYQLLRESGRLPIRTYVMLEGSEEGLLDEMLPQGPNLDPEDRLIIRTVKLYSDGALGSRGAALLDPYTDEPGTKGLLLIEPDHLEDLLRTIHGSGFQCAVHAIGDRANHLMLDLYEKILREDPQPDARHRIEHAQILAPGDIARFSQLGVVASMQFTHATSDMTWIEEIIGGNRITGAYAWKSILETGAVLAQGSDAPVESADPFQGLSAGMTRQDKEGTPEGGWMPQERLTPEEALAAATSGAARAAFLEDRLGRLKGGFWADFIICDTNPLTEPALRVRETQVMETWVGGKRVYP